MTDAITTIIGQAWSLYHRLVLVVGPPGTEISQVLQGVAESVGAPYVNVNLELSHLLLGLGERPRALRAVRLLQDHVEATDPPVVVLDHLEILFDRSLRLDPLRCLQDLSRHRVILAPWNGSLQGKLLVYAQPDHPEYYRAPAGDILLIENRSQGIAP